MEKEERNSEQELLLCDLRNEKGIVISQIGAQTKERAIKLLDWERMPDEAELLA